MGKMCSTEPNRDWRIVKSRCVCTPTEQLHFVPQWTSYITEQCGIKNRQGQGAKRSEYLYLLLEGPGQPLKAAVKLSGCQKDLNESSVIWGGIPHKVQRIKQLF